ELASYPPADLLSAGDDVVLVDGEHAAIAHQSAPVHHHRLDVARLPVVDPARHDAQGGHEVRPPRVEDNQILLADLEAAHLAAPAERGRAVARAPLQHVLRPEAARRPGGRCAPRRGRCASPPACPPPCCRCPWRCCSPPRRGPGWAAPPRDGPPSPRCATRRRGSGRGGRFPPATRSGSARVPNTALASPRVR